MSNDTFICDGIRTPIGRYGGALSSIRADDLAAIPLKALIERNPSVDWSAIDDIYYGCANQAGEDNRNVARMAALLAGLPQDVPAATVNRLCGSGLDAVVLAARAIKAGDAELTMAGGVESMSRAPFVMPKATVPFSRAAEIYDTTIGWRFINKKIEEHYGVESMPETAENLAEDYNISREDQDAYATRSQARAAEATARGFYAGEIAPVSITRRGQEPLIVEADEHPRPETTVEGLAKLSAPFREGGTVTAGNASGTNDGAAALILASESAAVAQGLTPKARFIGAAAVGLAPRVMGFGPVPAINKLLTQTGLTLDDMDVIEINEAFAVQVLSCTRALGLADDAEHVNPNGGAIALGHPLGMSGARLALTATRSLEEREGRYALISMCVGVGQGIAMIIERH